MIPGEFLNKLKQYGVGRRALDDNLFAKDKPPPIYTIYDADDENLCHEMIISSCPVPNCGFKSELLLEFENHYNTSHRYSCIECRKTLPTPHLLDLHLQEVHDSFFAVASLKKPMYNCFIEECNEKFWKPEERLEHSVKVHKLPRNFRFEPSIPTPSKKTLKKEKLKMEVEETENKPIFKFNNSKQKVFSKYTGRKFIRGTENSQNNINIDEVMSDLKDSLPNT